MKELERLITNNEAYYLLEEAREIEKILRQKVIQCGKKK